MELSKKQPGPAASPYSLRPYRVEDLPRLQEITVAVFGPVAIDLNMERILGPFGPSDWKERKAAGVAADCRLQPDGVFVAEDAGGAVVGYITTRLQPASGIGWIPNMAVDPVHQGQGLGQALLEHALDFLRASGMAVAKIETLEQNPVGQKLYPRLGFVEVARQIHYAMRLTPEEADRDPAGEPGR